jgi:solute carrier family 25 (adenine nucleotide translocator) protein 4/5/6/31
MIDPSSYTQKHWLLLANILAGGLASFFAVCFVYPLDFARTRLAVDMGRAPASRQFLGLRDCLAQTWKADGAIGLYRGFWVSAVGLFVYRGLYFGLYDFGRDQVLPAHPHLLVKFLFAQAVVIFSETISYPGDTIKRKMMMQSATQNRLYSGSLDCIRKVYKAEGMKGFMHGAYSNIIRSVGSSLCLVCYDHIKEIGQRP